MPDPSNAALWLSGRGADLQFGPAPYTPPGPGEVALSVRAIAVNPVDLIPQLPTSGLIYRIIMPWLRFPAIVGTDVAGEVLAVGPGVERVAPGDRVLACALGSEEDRNRSAEGGFQQVSLVLEEMLAPLPPDMTFAEAAVLPLALCTAATALFQADHLGLELPRREAPARAEAVIIWGGSTSVGMNAIQLARGAGYRVLTTASPHNAERLQALGAETVIDRRSPQAPQELLGALGGMPLAGVFAIGRGSLPRCIDVAATAPGAHRVASAQAPTPVRLQMLMRRGRGVQVSGIWGTSLRHTPVGPAIFRSFLPDALADGRFVPAPAPTVVGTGLEAIPAALERLRQGVSAEKLVVELAS